MRKRLTFTNRRFDALCAGCAACKAGPFALRLTLVAGRQAHAPAPVSLLCPISGKCL